MLCDCLHCNFYFSGYVHSFIVGYTCVPSYPDQYSDFFFISYRRCFIFNAYQLVLVVMSGALSL
jgi:hypothetical protein